ncbi:hypothetical protein [Thermococcus sp.]
MVASLKQPKKVRWLLLFVISFSIFTPSLMIIGDFLLHHKEAIIVVPLWFVWLYYLVPAGSIVYDVWSLLIAERDPWKRIKFDYNEVTFLMFLIVSACAWFFTHSLAITLPLMVSTVVYGFGIAKTVYLEVLYPVFIGVGILIEFHNRLLLLLGGEVLLLVYFLTLRRIREMMKQEGETDYENV